MTSCAYPGCPSTGTHEHEGKLYCEVHLPELKRPEWGKRLDCLRPIGRVSVQGREN